MSLLAQIDDKMEKINALRPFEGEYLSQIVNFFRVETTYSSNAIEGNTHTLAETKVILEDGITVGGHSLREFYEVIGHREAYDFMLSLIDKRDISETDILQCHRLFSQNIPNFVSSGVYRDVQVFISGSRKQLPPASDVPQLMKDFVEWLKSDRDSLHPILFAAEAHRQLVNIHPFTDGNGRVARLLMNTLLYQDRYFPVSIPPIRRVEYITLLEKNDSKKFGEFIVELAYETTKDMMRFLHIK